MTPSVVRRKAAWCSHHLTLAEKCHDESSLLAWKNSLPVSGLSLKNKCACWLVEQRVNLVNSTPFPLRLFSSCWMFYCQLSLSWSTSLLKLVDLLRPRKRRLCYHLSRGLVMVAAPRLWNSFPKELRVITNVNSFKVHINTYLFKTLYWWAILCSVLTCMHIYSFCFLFFHALSIIRFF